MEEEKETQPKQKRSYGAIAVIIFVIIAGLTLAFFSYQNYCESPVEYAIGDVDPRFKVSDSEVKAVAADAADRWNQETGKNEYTYSANAKLKINLVYDQRQADLDKMNDQVNSLNKTNESITDNNSVLRDLISKYETDLESYNSRVSYWNSKGGASTETFNALEVERKSLNKRREDINSMADLLNIQATKYNLTVEQIKSESEQNKNKLITQGMYFSKEEKIDIYTFGDKEELRLVLMHELGHAHGLDHAALSTSIMYPILGQQELSNPLLTSEDKQMILGSCPTRIINSFIWHTATSS